MLTHYHNQINDSTVYTHPYTAVARQSLTVTYQIELVTMENT